MKKGDGSNAADGHRPERLEKTKEEAQSQHRPNAAMAQKPELRLQIPSPPPRPGSSTRWRDIAQCDAGILPCEQPPRKGSPAQQDE
jgi:hypothetical protein